MGANKLIVLIVLIWPNGKIIKIIVDLLIGYCKISCYAGSVKRRRNSWPHFVLMHRPSKVTVFTIWWGQTRI